MPVKCKRIINKLNEFAPMSLAEDWDNVGLLIGDHDATVSKVLVALDATDKVVEEAIRNNVDMIITHHPIIFKGLKKINTSSVIGRKIIYLITHKISLFSAHTNLDSASEGISTILANKLQLENSKILVTYDSFKLERYETSYGIGRIGNINEMTLEDFCQYVKDKLYLDNIRVVGNLDKKINKVAISPGSSMEYANAAYNEGADVFVTGDIKYHDAQDFKEKGMALIDAGHFGTENIMVPILAKHLKSWFANEIEVITSVSDKDPFFSC